MNRALFIIPRYFQITVNVALKNKKVNFENREIFFSDRQSQSGSDFKTNADFFRSYFLSGDKKSHF